MAINGAELSLSLKPQNTDTDEKLSSETANEIAKPTGGILNRKPTTKVQ